MAKFITVKQAAEMVGVTPQSIRNLCKQGALSYKEEPQRFMVKLEEVKKLDYQIKEYDAIEGKIDELLADERKRHAEVVKTDKHNRFVLNELGLAPKRILMIRDLLVSILKSHYQDKITPREFQIVVDILGGRNVPDMKDDYNISVPHVTIIWRRALRRLALEKGMLQAKDDVIADLEKKILDLEDTILELKGLKKESAEEVENKRMVRLLSSKLRDHDLSVRSFHCLKYAEIDTVYDLVRYKRTDLLKFRNFGKKSLLEIDEFLDRIGLEFGMDVSKYELAVKEAVNGTR